MRGGGVHEGEDSPSPVSPGMVVAEGYRGQGGKAGMILERFWNDFVRLSGFFWKTILKY